MRKKIKKLLIIFCYYSGLSWIVSQFLGEKIFCIGYHSIFDDKNKNKLQQNLYSNISTSSVDFEDQIIFLKKNGHSFINFSDLEKPETKKMKKPTIIFFDDGFRDVLLNAAPILKKHGVPATVFITTGLISKDHILWTIGLKHFLFQKGETTDKIEEEIKELKKLSMKEKDDYLKKLYENNNFILRPQDFDIFLNWDDIKTLSQNGFEIGSHGVTHRKFTELDNTDLLKEMADSKKIIEEKIDKKIEFISYPHGRCNQSVKDAAKSAGYHLAVSTVEGLNSFNYISRFPFELKRIETKPFETAVYFKVKLYINI